MGTSKEAAFLASAGEQRKNSREYEKYLQTTQSGCKIAQTAVLLVHKRCSGSTSSHQLGGRDKRDEVGMSLIAAPSNPAARV